MVWIPSLADRADAVRKFYNGLGQLIQTQSVGVKLESATLQDIFVDYTYNAAGQMWKQSMPYNLNTGGSGYHPPSGQDFTQTTYDVLGRSVLATATDGTTTQTTYAITNTLTSAAPLAETCVIPAGDETRKSCSYANAWGQTVKVDAPLGPGVDYEYDAAGQLITVTYGTAVSTFDYNHAGMKTSMDDADMGAWTYGYDAQGKLTAQTDARGCTTSLDYDSLGRLLSKSYAPQSGGSCGSNTIPVNYSYDGITYPQQSFNNGTGLPDGWASNLNVSIYDNTLQLVGNGTWSTWANSPGSIDAGRVVRFAFKTSDVQSSATGIYMDTSADPSRGWNTSGYRRWGLTILGGRLKRESYDGNSTTQSLQDLMAVSAGTWYEAALTLNGPNGFQLLVWKRGDATAWGWDVVSHTDWSSLNWRFVAQPKYGTLQIDNYQEQAVRGVGQRTGMGDASGITEWDYNTAGQVVTETRVITGNQGTFVTQWSYHAGGLMASMTYPGGNAGQAGERLTYSYYPQGALKNVWSNLGTPTNSADDYYYLQKGDYDEAGRTTKLWLGGTYLANNPTVQNLYSYFDWETVNGAGRLKGITAGTVNDANSLLDLRYYTVAMSNEVPAYDEFGNLHNIYRYNSSDALLETQTFEYDAMDRLTSAGADGTGSTYDESYSYDLDTGNLSYKDSVGSYAYNAPRQGCTLETNSDIPHAVMTAGTDSYTYDCNGNMLSRPDRTLTFDAENRLTAVTGTPAAAFTYNADGARVIGTVGITTTVFIGEYLEWNVETSTMKSYYHAGGRRIAMRSGSGSDGLSWLIGDHLGSTTVTADANGVVQDTQLYRAFGEVRPGDVNSLATRYTFTGQADDGIGLMYFKARYLDPKLGRFISADSVVPSAYFSIDYDRYAYSRNSPIKYRDPSGHKACDGDSEEDCEVVTAPAWTADDWAQVYGIEFTGNWQLAHKWAVIRGVMAVGGRFADTLTGSSWEAFRSVFGQMTFQWGDCTECKGGGAYTASSHLIKFASMAANWRSDKELRWQNHVVHELGHAFNQLLNWDPAEALSDKQFRDPSFPNRNDYPATADKNWVGFHEGFASEQNILTWQMGVVAAGSPSEEFADQFLGWTYHSWEVSTDGAARSLWMNRYMRDTLRSWSN